MKNDKLKTNLKWHFELDEDIPSLDIQIPLKKEESKKTKIEIHKQKQNGRDSSTNNPGHF